MRCPKCHRAELVPKDHFRWQCPYIWDEREYTSNEDLGDSEDCVIGGRLCGFQCGLSFFFDDDNLSWKIETGYPIERLHLSPRAMELIRTGVLDLDEIERAVEIERLPSVQAAQQEEDELEEYHTMMRSVVGQSSGIHRHLTSGESYRKRKSGGLIGEKMA